MAHFEKLAFHSAQLKPSLWLLYVEDKFVVWPYGPEQLHNFLSHLNSLKPSSQFAMEIESDNAILEVLVLRKGMTLATKVHRKPFHTGRYHKFKYNHPPHVTRGSIQSLHNSASTICQK
jgi:hypothetical protein